MILIKQHIELILVWETNAPSVPEGQPTLWHTFQNSHVYQVPPTVEAMQGVFQAYESLPKKTVVSVVSTFVPTEDSVLESVSTQVSQVSVAGIPSGAMVARIVEQARALSSRNADGVMREPNVHSIPDELPPMDRKTPIPEEFDSYGKPGIDSYLKGK